MDASEAETVASTEPDAEQSETSSDVSHQSVASKLSSKTKPWEIQMDMLIQRLMMNSMHIDGDISVHNIDSRDSFTAESVASYMSDTASEGTPAAKENDSMSMDWDDEMQKSNQAAVAAAVIVAGRHQKRTLSFDGIPPTSSSRSRSSSSNGASSPTSPSMSPAFSSLAMPTMPPLPSTLFPTTPLPRTKSKKKNSMCQNCNGNHITIDCPLLANALPPGTPMQGAGGGTVGVDTVLRKCFTTIHNDNLSNSTHAFLGDEMSVRGGGNFSKGQWASAGASGGRHALGETSSWSSFGMNSISEDHSADVEDTAPVLLPLTISHPGAERKWDCSSWLISSLATELPTDVYETVRTTEKSCKDPVAHAHLGNQRHSLSSWVFVKEPSQKWCKRYLSLYRNSLWEFLDDKDASRPIGYANLSEGSVHLHQRTTLECSLTYYRHSTQNSARNECWLQFESEKDAIAWRDQLANATKLQVDDLFDLAPDALSNSPESYELGKGRFSVVRRACRKRSAASPTSNDSSSRQDCALKIIDKNVFWDLVAHETEREDTVIREILTQSLLTVRSASLYCPVIRLLSLFETRNLLVMELELMQEGDLHEEIVTHSAVDETRASYLVASLVKAIQYCLQNGVAHRDVKLSNLALDYGRCPKGRRYECIVDASSLYWMANFADPMLFSMQLLYHQDSGLWHGCVYRERWQAQGEVCVISES